MHCFWTCDGSSTAIYIRSVLKPSLTTSTCTLPNALMKIYFPKPLSPKSNTVISVTKEGDDSGGDADGKIMQRYLNGSVVSRDSCCDGRNPI